MLVVGQHTGQVAEAGLGAAGPAAAPVAVGAHHGPGGQNGIAELEDLRHLQGLELPGRMVLCA